MAVWLLMSVAAVAICIAAWWFYTRRLDWRFRHIESYLRGLSTKPKVNRTAGKPIMRQLYKILNTSITTGKSADAYQALDLLKLALGHGLARVGEPVRLTASIYLALRSNQLDAAGHAIDAFRPLLKNMTAAELPAAIEQLGLIAVVSLKQRKNFLAARAVEVIFTNTGILKDETVHMAFIRAIRLIGLIALRRKDDGLIREIQANLAGWLATETTDGSIHEQVAGIISAWLHQVVKTGNVAMFAIITQYVKQLADKKMLSAKALENIVAECIHLASMDSLNPFSQLNGQIAMFSLDLAVQARNINVWRQSLGGAMQASRLAVTQRTLAESFPVVYPLLETGRRLLVAELNSGPMNDLFRQKALYILIRECLQLVEFVSRQNFTATAADIIEQIYQEWASCQSNAGQHKSIKRFCQLLFLYCVRIKRRHKRLPGEESEFNAENVISTAEREHLKKIGYLS
ncbi:hypothetical protein [Sporomusa acidovorans]|uniref:Uncharacterized protein n=1 Tax=Sporomusa acidovorans (strain ATCC 49682 / DSM 3132 / Mol) TaxID=1123286 RepID=A0ABZ3J4V6_SPOA4|nr:hypothetical protein [Sporomusa acidovorans]OZC15483.1 hypothetical protein SPACI_47870 [Sporomusa acidovorans DSM 3132]SDE15831.1 hypothetical protein SAMN04488499_100913 [Sporomusa acidovorans]